LSLIQQKKKQDIYLSMYRQFIQRIWIEKTATNSLFVSQFTPSRSLVTGRILYLKPKDKESWGTEPEEHVLPEKEWKSMFHYFQPKKGLGIDVVHRLQKGVDLRPQAIKKWYHERKALKNVVTQSYITERVQAVGFDLAAAHFIVHRAGRVRFKGANIWTGQDKNGEYSLPGHYQEGVYVEAIDASGTSLVYEGLESMSNLRHLKWLSVATCPYVDDWCIDRICGQYGNTLEHLNLSYCRKVTETGISALARLRNLKKLNLEGMGHVKNIQMLCILLEESNSNLSIEGLDFLDEKFNDQLTDHEKN